MSKLTLLHINIIGAVVLLIVSVALYFTVITGAQDQIKKNSDLYKGVEDRANKKATAEKNLKNAQNDEVKTKADYAVYRRQYTPTLNYTGIRGVDMVRVWWPNNGKSWPERFIKGFKTHMNKESKKFGVVWENPEVLTLPANGPDPNSVDMGDNNKTLVFGPYPMVVRGGSFQALMKHIADWNTASGIGVPVVDGLQLTGNSPRLTATYNVTWTMILEENIPPKDPLLGGGGGGGGGAPGGRGGGGGPMFSGGPGGSGAPAMGGGSMGGGGGAMMGRGGSGQTPGNSGASMGGK
jgi:hypothetical protein